MNIRFDGCIDWWSWNVGESYFYCKWSHFLEFMLKLFPITGLTEGTQIVQETENNNEHPSDISTGLKDKTFWNDL